MKIALSTLIAALLATAVAEPPAVASDPIPLGEPVRGPLQQFGSVALASDGSGFFAVIAMRGALFGVRLDASGAKLDSAPILLVDDASPAGSHELVWRGDRWVLLWPELRHDAPTTTDLHYVEIAPDGTLLARRRPWLLDLAWPRAAWSGETLLVVAQQPHVPPKSRLRALRVGVGGVVENDRLLLEETTGLAHVAAAGGRFGVATASRSFFLLDEHVNPLWVRTLPGIPFEIVATDAHFHVPIRSDVGSTLTHLVLDEDGIIASHGIAPGGQIVRLVASADRVGTIFTVGFTAGEYVIDSAGRTLDIGQTRDEFFPAAAAATRDGEVVMTRLGRIVPSKIDALLSSADPDPATPLVVAAFDQFAHAVEAGDGIYLVVWLEGEFQTGRTLYAARVTASGQVLDEPLEIAREPEELSFGRASVTHGEGEFLVAWYAGARFQMPFPRTSSAWMRRVRADGTFVDAAPVMLSTATGAELGAEYPDAAWNGSEFLVVWRDGQGQAEGTWGARVGPSGASAPRQFAAGRHWSPRIAWDGLRYLLTWGAQRTEGPCPSCTFIDSLGMLRIDRVTNVLGSPVSIDGIRTDNPHLAAVAPERFILAWLATEREGDRWFRSIRTAGIRVDSGGVALGSIDTAFNANGGIVALEPASGFATLFWNQASPLTGLRSARIGQNGTVWAARLGIEQHTVDVAVGRAGDTLLVWTRRSTEAHHQRAMRAFGGFARDWFVLPSPPATPGNVEATRAGTMIDVRWDPVPGAAWYRVETSDAAAITSLHVTTNTSLLVHPYVPFIRVVAINAGGESAPSEPAEIRSPTRRRPVGR